MSVDVVIVLLVLIHFHPQAYYNRRRRLFQHWQLNSGVTCAAAQAFSEVVVVAVVVATN